jgi:hypothetical protein
MKWRRRWAGGGVEGADSATQRVSNHRSSAHPNYAHEKRAHLRWIGEGESDRSSHAYPQSCSLLQQPRPLGRAVKHHCSALLASRPLSSPSPSLSQPQPSGTRPNNPHQASSVARAEAEAVLLNTNAEEHAPNTMRVELAGRGDVGGGEGSDARRLSASLQFSRALASRAITCSFCSKRVDHHRLTG